MKRLYLFVLGLTVAVWGGGDVSSPLPAVIDIDKKECKTPRVYIQKGAGLMWQDAPYSEAETAANKRNRSLGKAGTWQHAMNYCRQLVYAGFDDWRLPTADELERIHRELGQAFAYPKDGDFWTSTATSDHRYYVVYPADGYRYKRNAKESNYIRCVRCIKKDKEKNPYRIKTSQGAPLFQSR